MKNTIYFFLSIFLILAATPAHGETGLREDCSQYSSTPDLSDCWQRVTDAWDKELNRVYKELMKNVPPQSQEALKEAQRQWVAQRDAEFKALQAIFDHQGTYWGIVVAHARADFVRLRALQLRYYLANEDPSSAATPPEKCF